MKMRLGAFLLIMFPATAFGGTYVVPNVTGPGNVPVKVGSKAQRLQEIIGSGQFGGPLVITGVRLRSSVGTGPVNLNYSSFMVTLSTTQAFPNTINGHKLASTTYATNVGPDATTVFNSAISASSPGCAGNGPCAFDMEIAFTTPFSYDPTKGRLLVDVVNSAASGTAAGSLDGISFPDPNSSTAVIINGDPNQPTGNLSLGGIILGLETSTPLITAIENSASNLTPALPNAGIAQGSIFIVQGSGLGPANIAIAASAFQTTTLSDTSVSVLVGTTKVSAPMYYTSDGQVAALLPSNTPAGSGTLTVIHNGQASWPTSVQVVSNNLGIFTIDSSGQGPGIVTYGDYSLVSTIKAANCGGPNTVCGAANPGDTLILWATGLGPVNGNDASGAGLGQNMPNIPLTLWLGGVKIIPSYQGRSGCCVGEDQIVFTVPDNVPTGCAVPLVAQIGNQVSNTTTMPVAAGSRTCTPVAPYVSLSQPALLAGAITTGNIELAHYSDGGGNFEDDARFQFLKIPPISPSNQPFLISFIDIPPQGTCTVYNNLNEDQNVPITGVTLADAGSSFTVNGPKGSLNLPVSSGHLSKFDNKGAFLVPGAYTIAGAGGTDIGPFNAAVTIPSLPTLTSPANNAAVTRANGLTVTWTGGSGNLVIEVSSPTDNTLTTGSVAYCDVDASAGTFTVPPYVLEALAATPDQATSGLVLSSQTGGNFTALGLSVGTVNARIHVAGFGLGWGSGGFFLK